jgi:hypothetical protein
MDLKLITELFRNYTPLRRSNAHILGTSPTYPNNVSKMNTSQVRMVHDSQGLQFKQYNSSIA